MEPQGRTKVVIPVASCIAGMTLMQSIVDENTGTIIVGKGQVLTDEILEKLKNFQHTQVWISIEEDIVNKVSIKGEQSVWKLDEHKAKAYKLYIQVLKMIVTDMKQGEILSIEQLIDIVDGMIDGFRDDYSVLSCVHLLDQVGRDEYTHSMNVACISLVLGRWLGYDERMLRDIIITALLHDIGKLDINPILIHKNESEMSSMEKLEYRRHPILGYERLATYNELNMNILKGILSHHERCDGTGYPLCLREDKINSIAKIIGLADTYDKLKAQYNVFEIVKNLETKMIRKFDINMLLRFCSNIMNYYVGALVLLNTNEIGEVVFIQSQALHRPIVKIKGEHINLYEKTHLEIVRVI